MEQRISVLVNLLETKVRFVREQKTRLQGVLDTYVDKVTERAQKAINGEGQDVGSIREMSTKMESTLEFLLDLSMNIEASTSGPSVQVSDDHVLPSASALSISTSPTAAYTQHPQSYDSESGEIMKLQNKITVVEAAIAMSRNEASQNKFQHNNEIKENKMLYHTLEERLDRYENLIMELKERQSTACGENAETTKKIGASAQGERLETAELQMQEKERSRPASEKEQNRRLVEFEDKIKQIQKDVVEKIMVVKAGIQHKVDQISNSHTELQEKQDERLNELENELNELQSQHEDLKKRVSSKRETMGKQITDLENKLANDQSRFQNLSDDVEKLKTQYSKKQQSSKLNSVEEQVEQLTSHLTAVEENVQEDIKQLKDNSVELTFKLSLSASKEDLYDIMKTSMALSNSILKLKLQRRL